jgi:CBS domain-containing protein
MVQKIKEIMTTNPVTLTVQDSVAAAARKMRDENIGDVLVVDGQKLRGIVTDRDIVVRAVAERKNPESTHLGEMCSDEIAVVEPNTTVEDVIMLMRERAVRRIPVVQDGKPVGIVSLGDLAMERDRRSLLGDISAAAPQS